jgi:hypothetical protein
MLKFGNGWKLANSSHVIVISFELSITAVFLNYPKIPNRNRAKTLHFTSPRLSRLAAHLHKLEVVAPHRQAACGGIAMGYEDLGDVWRNSRMPLHFPRFQELTTS